jgi:hypothetical protein
MEDARLPETEPSGALVPPPANPPTALAAAAPLLPRPRRDDSLDAGTLVALDRVGDSIASAVGLR